MMIESKLKRGSLTLDGIEHGTQAYNVRLEPAVDEQGDPVEGLTGDELGADEVTTWTLIVEAVQDFDDPAGFTAFCFDNAGVSVPFIWKLNDNAPAAGGTPTTATGSVKIRAVTIGGPVNTRNTHDAEFPCVGAVAIDWRG